MCEREVKLEEKISVFQKIAGYVWTWPLVSVNSRAVDTKLKWKDLLEEANKRRYLLDIYGTDSVSVGAGITNIVLNVLVPFVLYTVIQLPLLASLPPLSPQL